MIYAILFLVWCVTFAISPVFVLFMTALICLAVFGPPAKKNFKRTGSFYTTKSADNMTIDELDNYTVMRKMEEATKDWDGTPAPGMKGYYEKELDRIMKKDPDDENSLREKEELKAHIARNRAKEDAKMEKEELDRKRFEQILEKAHRNAKIARKNASIK